MPDPFQVHSDALKALNNPMFRHSGHGWVLPNPDGRKATCGGPTVCRECALEAALLNTHDKVTIVEGLKVTEGDHLLLIANPNMSEQFIGHMIEQLQERFKDINVDITVVQGFTGVQIHRQNPEF